jgi:hypothetical protein
MNVKSKWVTMSLTAGKVYYVINDLPESYQIVNDDGTLKSYLKNGFEVVPEGKPIKVICINNDNTCELTLNKAYFALDDDNYWLINDDEGDAAYFCKTRFKAVPETKAVPNKIRMIEYATTTDDKVHMSQEKAEAHQAELDTQSFKGPFIRGIQKLGIGTMVAWASTNPESFQTLLRLVREQQSNE